MNEAIRRAIRTFFQGFVGVLALVAIPALNAMVQAAVGGDAIELNVDVWQSIGIAAIAGGVIALVSWAQNELEAHGAVKPLLKNGDTTEAS